MDITHSLKKAQHQKELTCTRGLLQVQLHRPLQLLDEVLQSMPIPGPEPRINRNLLLNQAGGGAAAGGGMQVS